MGTGGAAMRSGAVIAESRRTLLLKAAHPFAHRPGRDPELGRDPRQGVVVSKNGNDELLSTKDGESGILVDVHSVEPRK